MKSHRFDLLSFVFGALFLLVAAAAVWDPSLRWDLGAWLVPAAVLTLGIGLLVSTLRSGSDAASSVPLSRGTAEERSDDAGG